MNTGKSGSARTPACLFMLAALSVAGCERHAVVGANHAALAKMSRVDVETNILLLESKVWVLEARIRILEGENALLKERTEP